MEETKKKNPLKILLATVIVLSVLFLALTFKEQHTLRIGIFYGSNWEVPGTMHYDIIDQAIEKYKKEHPAIRVVYEEGIPSEDYSEWLFGEILKGTEPDLYLILEEDFQTLAAGGMLKPLDTFLAADDEAEDSAFYPMAVAAGQYQKKQYALPFSCNPTLMFVNKTLLKKEGIALPDNYWTWEEFYTICRQTVRDTDGDGKLDQFGCYGYTWDQAVYANGIRLFNEAGTESTVTDDRFLEAMEFVRSLEETNQGYQVSADDFDLGHVVFRPLTFSDYRTYMPYPWRIKKYSDFEWNCMPMPAGPSGTNTSSMETLLFGMSARTHKEKEAWDFLKLLTMDEEIQKLIYKDSSGASPLKAVTRSDEVMEFLNEDTPGGRDIDLSLLDQAIANAAAPENFRLHQEVYDKMDSVLSVLTKSRDDIRTALFNLTRELDEMLRQ